MQSRRKVVMKKSAHDNPSIPKATTRELQFYNRHGLIIEAIEVFAHIVQLFPNDFLVRYHLGLNLYNYDRFEESLAHFKEALRCYTEPEEIPLFRVFYRIGATLTSLKRFEEALEYINKSEQMMTPHENNADIYYMRAVIYDSLDRHEEEVIAYDHAIALEPMEPVYYVNKTDALITLGRFEEAVDTLNLSIELELETCLTHFLRGYAAFKMGNFVVAKEEYASVELFTPNRKEVYDMKKEFLDGMEQLEPPNKKQKL